MISRGPYTFELDRMRQSGCTLSRAFPYTVRDREGVIVQFAKTEEGAQKWIAAQLLSEKRAN